jgi:mannose-6-phosphate isomerase-like protein (cupin superfamily)
MSSEVSEQSIAIPADDPARTLTVGLPDTDASLPHVAIAGDTYTIVVAGKDTAGRYTLIDMLVPPGGGPPPHRHDFEEMFTLLEGEIEFTFRGGGDGRASGGDDQHSGERTPPFPQRQRQRRSSALHVLPGGPGGVLPRGWRQSRRPDSSAADVDRIGAGGAARARGSSCAALPDGAAYGLAGCAPARRAVRLMRVSLTGVTASCGRSARGRCPQSP